MISLLVIIPMNTFLSSITGTKFSKSAHVYLNFAEAEVTKHTNFIKNMDKEDLAFYKK